MEKRFMKTYEDDFQCQRENRNFIFRNYGLIDQTV